MAGRKERKEAVARVACAQFASQVGEKERNIRTSLALLETAAAERAQLVVMPELANSGYVFQTRAEAFAMAEPIPSGPTVEAWIGAANHHSLYLCAGICEREDGRLYNSAVLIGPEGHIGTYRKNHLWSEENLFFEPGDRGFPVFHTPIGRLAMLICYDAWFPEAWRLCALQGADIVCMPSNWARVREQDPSREAMANILCMAAAHSNVLFIAAANRVGKERGHPFIGQSVIVSYTGWPTGGPASSNQEEIIYADCNLADARRKRGWNEFNHALRDRRTDVYDEMLGTSIKPGWY